MIETPRIIELATQATAVIRLTIRREEMQTAMGPGITELLDTVRAQGMTPTGPWLTHHLRMAADIFDFEIAVPVAAPVVETGRVRNGELPAATVARTIYHGPYEGLGDAWGEFDAWITAHGRTAGPSLWETYVAGPEAGPDAAAWRTELTRPLAA